MLHMLGMEAYGIVGLAMTFPGFVQLAVNALARANFRYIATEFSKGNRHASISFFNTGCVLLAVVSGTALIPIITFACIFPSLYNVPSGMETDSRILVALLLLATILSVLRSPFVAVHHLIHRLTIVNAISLSSKILAVTCLIVAFRVFKPSITHIGAYQVLLSLISSGLIIWSCWRLQSFFRFHTALFSAERAQILLTTSFDFLLYDMASLLYLAAGYSLINLILGADACGRFAPIMLVVATLNALSSKMAAALEPILTLSAAKEEGNGIFERRLSKATRIHSFFCGTGTALVAGLSQPILATWMGVNMSHVWLEMTIIVIGLYYGGIAFAPCSQAYRARNALRLPAYVHVAFGVLNVIMAYTLMRYAGLGTLGLAISFLLTFGLRGVAFNYFYVPYMLHSVERSFLLDTWRVLVLPIALVPPICLLAFNVRSLNSLLLASFLSATVVCCTYWFALEFDDRRFLSSMITRRKPK